MQAWHQKNQMEPEFPFLLGISESLEFPPHWHEEIELIYVLEGKLMAGLNHDTYFLQPRDILLISPGDVHYFFSHSKPNRCVVLRFAMPFLDSFSMEMGHRRFTSPLLQPPAREKGEDPACVYSILERQILEMVKEQQNKEKGYQMVLKARLYDIGAALVRNVPTEINSSRDRSKQLSRLERLQKVFRYVEERYAEGITLKEIARVANFSIYHFTRFFKEATGMTFNQYLSNLRIRRAVQYLRDTEDPVTEVAFKTGFNSIKTFNRVFKEITGFSPTEYRKSNK